MQRPKRHYEVALKSDICDLHPQVVADLVVEREARATEADSADAGVDGGTPAGLLPQIAASEVDEKRLAVAHADLRVESSEECNLTWRELRLLLHLGVLSTRLQRKFTPAACPANTVTNLRTLWKVMKNIDVEADETTTEALAVCGLTPLDSVLRNEQVTAVVDHYSQLLQQVVAGDTSEALLKELHEPPAKFSAKVRMCLQFDVLEEVWDVSFGEGSLCADVYFDVVDRVVAEDDDGDDGAASASATAGAQQRIATAHDNDYDDDDGDGAGDGDHAESPLDMTFDERECVSVLFEDGRREAMLPPGAYAKLENGTTACNVEGRLFLRDHGAAPFVLARVASDEDQRDNTSFANGNFMRLRALMAPQVDPLLNEPAVAAVAAAAPNGDNAVSADALNPYDVETVMNQTKCTRDAAVAALIRCRGDIVDAILALTP